MREKNAPIELVTQSENFYFLNSELVTQKQKNKSLTNELVTWSEIKYFHLPVSNSKGNFLFLNFELVTRKWNKKIFNYRVGNLK